MKKWFFTLIVSLALCSIGFAQAAGDYRSAGTGEWYTPGTWQIYNGSTWVAATTYPNSETASVTIQNGHTVNIYAFAAKCKDLTVDSGGMLHQKMQGQVFPSLTIYGNLTANGTIRPQSNATSGYLTFSGNATHNIYGTGAIGVGNAKIDISVGDGATLVFNSTSTLAGTGSLSIGSNVIIQTANANGLGYTTATPTGGSIPYPRTITYTETPTSMDVVFNGSGTQNTGTKLTTADNVYINGPSSLAFSGSTTINGTFYNPDNSTFSGTVAVDGYDSPYIDIQESGILLSNFTASTTTTDPDSPDYYVDRTWSITSTSGTASGGKNITLYWDATDDDSYTWPDNDATVFFGSQLTPVTPTSRSLSSNPRYVTFSWPQNAVLSPVRVGRDNNAILPVELSSFTALHNNLSMVTLQWVTQSETNVYGFRIYRGTKTELSTAIMLNIFIPATNTSQMQVYQVTDEEVYQDGTYYYWLENIDLDGSSALYGPVSITVNFGNTGAPPIPITQGLHKAYPMPFHPEVNLELGMVKAGLVELGIYNMKGQLVRSLYSGNLDMGTTTLRWDSRDNSGSLCANGIYFAVMRTDSGAVSTLKLTLMK